MHYLTTISILRLIFVGKKSKNHVVKNILLKKAVVKKMRTPEIRLKNGQKILNL